MTKKNQIALGLQSLRLTEVRTSTSASTEAQCHNPQARGGAQAELYVLQRPARGAELSADAHHGADQPGHGGPAATASATTFQVTTVVGFIGPGIPL